MLMVYQEPMILQWAKVVTVISILIHRIILTRTIKLGHKMKKRVMALLVHNKTRWVGLSAEAERQGHP
jgi:DMSO reductase anchor subunit